MIADRRPISRRLMTVLFGVLIVPVSGWYFLGELSSRDWGVAADGDISEIDGVLEEIRFKLALVLAASVVVLGAAIAYLRRLLIDPLADLALRARQLGDGGGWSEPPQTDRPDEIGDLARALDQSVHRLAARAEAAERLATDLSHELKTPLAAIRGAAEILGDPEMDAAARERFLGNIRAESSRLERLTRGLLELEQSERRELTPPRIEELDPVRLVTEFVDRIAPVAERHRIEISVRTESVPPIRSCEDYLERILFALLENAIKFSPPGERVDVVVRPTAGGVGISIGDRGPGLPAELGMRIFDRHVTDPERGERRGSGLGLAIVSRLVAALGGSIEATSRPGGGARFRFELPPEPTRRRGVDR